MTITDALPMSQMAMALQRAVEKTKNVTPNNPALQVALKPVGSESLSSNVKQSSRKTRRIMSANQSDNSSTPGEGRRPREFQNSKDVLKLTVNGMSVEIPYDGENPSQQKFFAELVSRQTRISNATAWAGVIGQIGGATLAVVGAIAMTWAIIQGVKHTTKSD